MIELSDKEYNYVWRQCQAQSYKMAPIPNFYISYMGSYVKSDDTLIYKLRNVSPPDYKLVILNMSQRVLIVKQVQLYDN